MLKARRVVGIALGATWSCIAFSADAQDDEPEGFLHRPERQTVSVADDFLGQLSLDGRTLYFVSNRNQRSEIFAQTVADGRARVLFDDNADVTWPRVSPDGKQLLYVSFRDHVHGQLCIRSLPDGDDRRCFVDASAIVQAEWIDRSRIVAVSRPARDDEVRLLEVEVGSKLTARRLLDRNLAEPAVSPKGEWLVYVPLERGHAGRRLEAVRLGSPDAPATPLVVDLPGLTGQPAFTRDGRSLVIAQFVDDTNHDGVIDANDDGILYRVPFAERAGTPVLGPPQQLTESSSNCEYPAPATDRLIATCAKKNGNGLEIYALPLDGEAPPDWTPTRLAAEIEAAGSRSEQQLLASLRLARETAPAARVLALLGLVRLHLALDQFDSAEFYASRLADLRDATTEGLSSVVRVLVEQRRAAKDRERGLRVGSFAEQARRRLEGLSVPPHASPSAIAFEHVVRSEIADAMGDKAQAQEQLEAVAIDASAPVAIVEAYYERADALYRELDDREALVRVGRRLSESPALTPDERLRYARAAVRAMVRGAPFDEATARIARERASVAPDSELAFVLDVARALLLVRDAHPPRIATEELLAIYARQPRPGRRRALVDAAVTRASELQAYEVVEELAHRNILDVRRGTTDRRSAERLYRRVMSARALRRGARADFDAIVEQTDSYEALVGSIDLRLRAGESAASISALYTQPGTPMPRQRFARAYVLARQLPALEAEAASRATAEALALLRASWSELAGKRIVQALEGALLHDQYIRTGDRASAEQANIHYGIALEQMSRGSRFRPTVLGQLGILQTQVGNYRVAVGYFEERDKLPFTDPPGDLAVHLAHARALLHAEREADAATTAERAVALLDHEPGLAPYRVLVLDRAAMCNLAASRFPRALALYDLLIPRLDAMSSRRNRFVARLARASAAVGAERPERALADLDEVDRELRGAKGWGEHVVRMYSLLATGLRARAYRQQNRFDEEARALGAERAALQDRFVTTHRDEDQRRAMLAEMQLALNARDRHDPAAAASWLTQALARADDLRARARGELDNAQLDALWLAAELTLEMKTPLVRDLAERLEVASGAITASQDPSLRAYGRWFEVYLPVVR
jgi:hypothetical protein